jgi:Zn-dependent membrane protease YugP
MRDWFLLVVILSLEYGPRFLFERVMRRYGAERADLPFTGRELARRLLDQAELADLAVETLGEETPDYSDQYDDKARVVRLSATVANRKSVAAYAVAAHEVGHAMQFAERESWLVWEEWISKLLSHLQWVLLIAVGALVLFALSRDWLGLVPAELGSWIGIVLYGLLGCGLVLRFVTLPYEFDASFNRALPMLTGYDYLQGEDLRGARRVLAAAAFTYAAFAALGLVSIAVLLGSR